MRGLDYEYHLYQDHQICLYQYDNWMSIIDLKQGKLVNQFKLPERELDFYCCSDPRYIIIYSYKEFMIKDLLENKEQKHTGFLIGQNNNVVLFSRDENYFLFSIEGNEEKQLSNIKKKEIIAWVGKFMVGQEERFYVFHTFNRQLMKIQLKRYQQEFYPLFQNQIISQYNDLNLKYNQFMHIIRLNNKTKIIRRLKVTPGQTDCQIHKQFIIIRNDYQNVRVINILKATSQFIPIQNHQIFIGINDSLFIFSPNLKEFEIKAYQL